MLNAPPKRRYGGGPLDQPDQTFSTPEVPNQAALVALPIGTSGLTSALPEGWEVYVTTYRTKWRLRTTAVAPVANQIVTSTADPTRQWWRLDCEGSPNANPWLGQTAWWVAGAGGNDENAGTVFAPLATYAEWKRRFVGAELRAIYTVNFSVNQPDGVSSTPKCAAGGCLVLDFQFGATTVVSTTCTLFIDVAAAPVPPASDYALIQGAPGWDWTTYLNRRVRIVNAVSGITLGIFWVMQVAPGAFGVGVARITRPVFVDLTAIPSPIVYVTPAPTNLLIVENLLPVADTTLAPVTSQGDSTAIILANCDLTSPAVVVPPYYNQALLYGCQLFYSLDGCGNVWGCGANQTVGSVDVNGQSMASPFVVRCCGFYGAPGPPFRFAPYNVILQDSILQNAQLAPRCTGEILGVGAIGIYDVNVAGASVTDENASRLFMQLRAGCDVFGYGGGFQRGIYFEKPSSLILYAAADPPTVATTEGSEFRNNAGVAPYAGQLNIINAASVSGLLQTT